MTKKFSIKKLVAGVLAAAMVVTALPVSGLTVKAADGDAGNAVLCAYNPNNGEHLFTTDKAEYDYNVKLGYTGEGAKWTAAASGSTPLTRVYNPNSGEHLLLPEGEVASVVAAGWSNEGVKMYSDDNKGVPIYRLFNPNETRAGSHHYTPSRDEAASLAAVGWTWEYNQQPVFYGMGEDLSGEITLKDSNGLQTNGTALPTDRLTVEYGSSLGTPNTIIWYCNGAVKNAVTLDSGRLATGFNSDACLNGDLELDDGEWWVSIENTDGRTFVSNKVVVASNNRAVMSAVSFEDDYDSVSTGASIVVISDKTNNSILNVTFNKFYNGTLYVAKEGTKKFAIGDMVTGSAKNLATLTKVNREAELTNKNATADGDGVYWLDKNGVMNCKIVCGANLTRGDKYFLVFDQRNISEDDLGATATATTVNSSASAEVPYVNAPAKVAVTTFSQGTSTPEVTMYDKDGKEMEWWTKTNGQGLESVKFYAVDSNEASDSDAATVATVREVKKGVIKATTASALNKKYAYVKVKTGKGVFGEKAIELTSTIGESATAPMDAITIGQSDSDPADAEITLKGLSSKAPGTVLVFQGDSSHSNFAQFSTYEATDAIAYKHVAGGTSKTTIEDVFTARDMRNTVEHKNLYAVMFVPDDTELWKKVGGGDKADDPNHLFDLKPAVKSFDKKSATATTGATITISGIEVLDQFGDPYAGDNVTNRDYTMKATAIKNVAGSNGGDYTSPSGVGTTPLTFVVSGTTHDLTIVLTPSSNNTVKKGDGWTIAAPKIADFTATLTAKDNTTEQAGSWTVK